MCATLPLLLSLFSILFPVVTMMLFMSLLPLLLFLVLFFGATIPLSFLLLIFVFLLSAVSFPSVLLLSGTLPRTFLDLTHRISRSEEHTSELQSRRDLVCSLLLEKKNSTCIALRSAYCHHTPNYLGIYLTADESVPVYPT